MIIEAVEELTSASPVGREKKRRGRERRRVERREIVMPARYQRLWSVFLIDVGPEGLRLESDVPFRFGAGRLRVDPAGPAQRVVGIGREIDVTLIWSRLVATEKGEFGEICPRFHSGLAVDEASRAAWRRTLQELSRAA